MKNNPQTRTMKPMSNRTAGSLHPEESADQAEFARRSSPSSPSDGALSARVRQDYASEAMPIGTLPLSEGKKRVGRPALFLDKLGERMAFERTGCRLYEALISKHGAPAPAGIGSEAIERRRLEEIWSQEQQHFRWLVEAVRQMGGDPTAVTPSANIASLISSGLPKVVQDPRTSFNQCIDAMLVAELADYEAWAVLIRLADELGEDQLVDRFQEALRHEEEHLMTLRELVESRTEP